MWQATKTVSLDGWTVWRLSGAVRCGVVGYETAYSRGTVESNKLEGKLLNLDKLKFFLS